MNEETKPKKKSNRARSVGHTWERDCGNILKEIGFEHICTTRAESRSRDNQKIDLMNKDEHKHGRLPYNIQCKKLVMAIKGKNFTYPDFAYPDLLNSMPQGEPEINVIFHEMTEKRANGKFYAVGQYAHLKLYDFIMMMKQIKDLQSEVILLKEGKLTP